MASIRITRVMVSDCGNLYGSVYDGPQGTMAVNGVIIDWWIQPAVGHRKEIFAHTGRPEWQKGEANTKMSRAAYRAVAEQCSSQDRKGPPPSEKELFESVVIRQMYSSGRGRYYQVWNEGHMIEQVRHYGEALDEAYIWLDKNEFALDVYYMDMNGNINLLDGDGSIVASWT